MEYRVAQRRYLLGQNSYSASYAWPRRRCLHTPGIIALLACPAVTVPAVKEKAIRDSGSRSRPGPLGLDGW